MTGTRNLSHFVRHLNGGVARLELEVDGLRAGCRSLVTTPIPVVRVASRDAVPPVSGDARGLSTLLHGLVIAVLAALAVRLLSVAMHGLGTAADTTPAHDLFPWLAAAIAIPSAAWAGRTIFVSSVRAVATGA